MEISNILQEAAQQYEEYFRLANLAEIANQSELYQPRYGWDNPIGLVIEDRVNGELVLSSG